MAIQFPFSCCYLILSRFQALASSLGNAMANFQKLASSGYHGAQARIVIDQNIH